MGKSRLALHSQWQQSIYSGLLRYDTTLQRGQENKVEVQTAGRFYHITSSLRQVGTCNICDRVLLSRIGLGSIARKINGLPRLRCRRWRFILADLFRLLLFINSWLDDQVDKLIEQLHVLLFFFYSNFLVCLLVPLFFCRCHGRPLVEWQICH